MNTDVTFAESIEQAIRQSAEQASNGALQMTGDVCTGTLYFTEGRVYAGRVEGMPVASFDPEDGIDAAIWKAALATPEARTSLVDALALAGADDQAIRSFAHRTVSKTIEHLWENTSGSIVAVDRRHPFGTAHAFDIDTVLEMAPRATESLRLMPAIERITLDPSTWNALCAAIGQFDEKLLVERIGEQAAIELTTDLYIAGVAAVDSVEGGVLSSGLTSVMVDELETGLPIEETESTHVVDVGSAAIGVSTPPTEVVAAHTANVADDDGEEAAFGGADEESIDIHSAARDVYAFAARVRAEDPQEDRGRFRVGLGRKR